MPNKPVSWTQVPVVADDLLSIHYDRSGGGQNILTVHYQVKDSLGAVRFRAEYRQTGVSYPVTGASILSGINAQEGT